MRKKGSGKRRLSEPFHVFILALVMYVVTVAPIILWHKGLFFYYGDYNVQQVPFYVLAHRLVREGRFFFTLNLDLGGSLTGDMAFYLMGSPFFWLTYPLGEKMIPYCIPFLMALKYATCALSAFVYIRRYTKTFHAARIGALLYAFSGFNACNIVFNHFTDVVAFFPLLLLTFENLLNRDIHPDGEPADISEGYGDWLKFALTVTLVAVINYYFFFGMALFLVLYYFLRYFDVRTIPSSVTMFVRALTAGVTGVMIAGFYLALALDGVAGNSRLDNILTGYDLLFYPSAMMYADILRSAVMVPDIIGKGTLFYHDTVRNASLALYLPMFGISGVVAFLRTKRFGKDVLKRVLIACMVIAAVPAFNACFSMLNTQYYARWFYIPVLFMALATAIMTEKQDIAPMRKGSVVTAALFFVCALLSCLPVKDGDGTLTFFNLMENEKMFYRAAAVTTVMVVFLLLLYFAVKNRKRRMRLMTAALVVSCVLSTLVMLFNGKTLISDYGMEKWKEQMLDTKPELTRDSFYRIETDDTATNYEMVWGIPTIHCFLSTVPAEIFDFYEKTAGWKRTVESNISLDKPGLRALLSERYFVLNSLINEDHVFLTGEGTYGFEQTDVQNGFTVFENKNYIPPGFTFDAYIRESTYATLDKTAHDRLLVKAIILSDEDADRYGYLMREILIDEATQAISDEAFDALCAERRDTACVTFTEEKDGFYAVTDVLEKESLVFFSVPDMPGFRMYVDGAESDIIRADHGLMAVRVNEGRHEIRAVFAPSRIRQGAAVSAAGVIFALLFYLFGTKEKLRRQKEENLHTQP